MDLITITGIESIKLDAKTGEVIYITPAFKIFKPKGTTGNDNGNGECEEDEDCEELLPPLIGFDRVCIDGRCHYRRKGD